MKLKKAAKILLSAVIAGALFTGCGQSDDNNQKQNLNAKIGIISHMNAGENQLNNYMSKYVESRGIKTYHHEYVFYDNLNLLIMGLNSKSVDEISTYNCVAQYVTAKNGNLEILDDHIDMSDNFCFAMRKDDVELKNAIDNAIKSLKDDGLLDKLIEEYITNVKNIDPSAVEFTKIDGVETIKVGITGDVPPLDLVTNDGKPAGFNTAVLSEIGKRIGKNVELVQIEGGARAAALTSKQIDVIFWATAPKGDALKFIPATIDKPDNIEFSSPYYEDSVVHIGLKK